MKKLLLGLVASLVGVAFATDYTWTGGGDGETWSNAANWGKASPITWTSADTVTFTSSAEVTVDADALDADDLLPLGKIVLKNAGTVVTIHGSDEKPDGAIKLFSVGGTGLDAAADTVLNLDVPLTYDSVRVDLVSLGTVRYSSRITFGSKTTHYSRIADVIFTKGARFDASMSSQTVSPTMGYQNLMRVRMEEDAEVKYKNFQFAIGSYGTLEDYFIQDGADTKLIVVNDFAANHDANAYPQHFVLRDGTLTVGGTARVTTDSGTAGGDFTQEGGTASFAGHFELMHGNAVFSNGTCTIAGELRNGSMKASPEIVGAAYVYNGMDLTIGKLQTTLHFCGGDSDEPAHVHFTQSGTPSGAKLVFEPGAKVKLTADAAVTLKFTEDTVLPDDLDIGENVTLQVDKNVQLTSASTTPLAITIRAGGHLNLCGQTAYIAAPIDLSIEDGGQLWVESSSNNRGIIVAHSYTLAGVKQNRGRYLSVNDASAALRGSVTFSLYVPYTWTGAAGDGDIGNSANWEDGAFGNSNNQMLDFSRATAPVKLGSSVSAAAIAYLPPSGGEPTLTLRSEGDAGQVILYGVHNTTFYSAAYCRRGCTIDFDVDFKNGGKDRNGWIGAGTFRFERALNANCVNYFVLDGFVDVAGTLAPTDGLRFFTNHDTPLDRGILRFVEGANVALTGPMTTDNNDGFLSGHAYEQTGGSVTAKSLCMVATRSQTKDINTYTLSDGTLTLTDDINLGGQSTVVPDMKPLPTGTFVMTGGTLNVPKIMLALNSNWCKLSGGTVNLGTDGFTKAIVAEFAKSEPNTTPGLEFGGVTFVAANSWTAASELDVNLTGLNGNPVFDVAAEQTVTVAGAVSGVGGFIKRGPGALAFTGTYSATGDITVEAGTVTFASVAQGLSMGTLDVCSAESLDLPDGATVAVAHLVVGGQRKGSGTYSFGGGEVTVTAPSTTYTWIGPDGGNWSDTANWYGGAVPNGADVDLDFSESTVPATIAVDTAVQLKSLHLDWGTVTLAPADGGSLSLGAGAEVTVDAGATIDFAAETRIARVTGTNFTARLQKKGPGTAKFSGLLRSGDDSETLAFGQGAVCEAVEGEVQVAGEVEGVHVYPLSYDPSVVPLVHLVDGAVMTNKAWLTGTFDPYSTSDAVASYGAVVMDGGTVQVTKEMLQVFGSNGNGRNGSGAYKIATKNCFAWMGTGSSSVTINGGVWTVDAIDGATLLNGNNSNGGGADSTLTINGGLLNIEASKEFYFGLQNGCRDVVTIKDGEFRLVGPISHASGSGENCRTFLNLNGGRLTLSGVRSVDWFKPDYQPIVVTIGGAIEIAEMASSGVLTFEKPVRGDIGKITHLGPGKLAFQDLTGLSETNKFDLALAGGELELTGKDMNFGRIDFSGAGKLALVYEGTKDADALYTNGRQRGAGLYGASARQASRFTSTGLLNVLTGENYGVLLLVR